jgi:hypothetical protein
LHELGCVQRSSLPRAITEATGTSVRPTQCPKSSQRTIKMGIGIPKSQSSAYRMYSLPFMLSAPLEPLNLRDAFGRRRAAERASHAVAAVWGPKRGKRSPVSEPTYRLRVPTNDFSRHPGNLSQQPRPTNVTAPGDTTSSPWRRSAGRLSLRHCLTPRPGPDV